MSIKIKNEWIFDFENGLPQGIKADNASVTNDPAWIIKGRGSLACDSRNSGKEWNEFLHTDPKTLPLTPGHIYQVIFDYRAIDPGDNTYYCLMRSASQPTGGSLDHMTGFQLDTISWDRPICHRRNIRYSGTYSYEFCLPHGVNDYYLIIGIQNKAILAIDNLRIQDKGTAADIPVSKIKSGFPISYQKDFDDLLAYRKKYGIAERMGHVRIPSRDDGTNDEALIAHLQEEIPVDYCSWWFGQATGDRFGVRCSRGGAEYNGYYKVEAPNYWENRFEYFRGRGFIEGLDDNCLQDVYWGEGGYQTCQNGDHWHHVQQLSMLQWLNEFDDVSQDNLTWCAFYMGGCYCASCRSQFREYMKSRYSFEEMKKLGKGVEDIDTFDMREYIKIKLGRPTGMDIVKDPIFREYIKFQNIAHFAVLLDHFTAFRQLGEQQERGVAMYGNQNGIEYTANASAISPLMDVLEVECTDHDINYIIARGSGLDEKMVWVRGLSPDRPFGVGLTYGGIKNIQYWWKRPDQTENPEEVIDTSRSFPIYKAFVNYLNNNRALYGKQRGYTNTAVVWSLPSLMWRSYPPQNLYSWGYAADFITVAQALIDSNVMFDCALFHHPEIHDDKDFLARLMEYDTVILPNVDCLSKAQAAALRKMSKMGKRILVLGELGERDEDFNRVNRSKGINFTRLDRAQDVLDYVQPDNAIRISTNPSDSISATIFKRLEGRLLIISLLNRENEDKMLDASWSSPITVKIRIPEGFAYDTIYVTSWEHDEIEMKPKAIDAPKGSSGGSWIEVTVPKVQHYSAIVFGKKAEIDKENAAELTWIAEDREQVKRDFEARRKWYEANGQPEKIMP